MYASASTWAFNVVRKIVETSGADRVQAAFVSGAEASVNWGGAGKTTIVKSHEIKGEARVLEVARRASKILVTVRDPRDSVASLMQAHAYEFSRALTLVEHSAFLCRSFAKDQRAKLLSYESGFFEKIETVAAIARHLGMPLEAEPARTIHDSLTRAEVERYIRGLPNVSGILKDKLSGDLLDPGTQWHSHHSGRNGEIGKWRKLLTAKQTDEIMSRLRDHSDLFQAP